MRFSGGVLHQGGDQGWTATVLLSQPFSEKKAVHPSNRASNSTRRNLRHEEHLPLMW